MLLVSSRIWTSVTVSISNDDNHYTTGTFLTYSQSYLTCKRFIFVQKGKFWQTTDKISLYKLCILLKV